MEVKKILLVGNYNAGNIGDDLLKNAALKGLAEIFPHAEVKLMCNKGDAPLFPAGVRSYLKFNYFKAKKAVKWCDLVIFGGGGLLNTDVLYSLRIWGKVIKNAYKINRPVVMLGQSFSEKITLELEDLLEMINFITLRDTFSKKILLRLDLKVPYMKTADLVFLMDVIGKNKFVSEFNEYVLLNLREYRKLNSTETLLKAKEIVDRILLESSNGVYLVPFDKQDEGILKQLESNYSKSGRVKLLKINLDNYVSVLKGAKYIISMRLHLLLLAVLFEKPLLALSYASKVRSTFRDLDLEDYVVDLRSDKSYLPKGNLCNYLNEQADNKIDVSALRKKARSNFELLRAFVDDL